MIAHSNRANENRVYGAYADELGASTIQQEG
jgi:hypothetical protein